jgi:hypothetical protein
MILTNEIARQNIGKHIDLYRRRGGIYPYKIIERSDGTLGLVDKLGCLLTPIEDKGINAKYYDWIFEMDPDAEIKKCSLCENYKMRREFVQADSKEMCEECYEKPVWKMERYRIKNAEWHLEHEEKKADEFEDVAYIDACEVALSAIETLRKEGRIEMPDALDEPCEFCEDKKYMQGSAFLEDGQIEVSIQGGDFNFCPSCGRKL